MKHVIIGGVAGGATAAARIRRADESAEIILLEKGQYISYANCGLPYYIGGVIEERDKLFVQTPAEFAKRFKIDVRTQNEALAIDADRKVLIIKGADGKEYSETYDKLLLSPGASPVRPPLEGIDLEGIFTLRNVNDTDNIKEYLLQRSPRKAVVVGGGFIGLEMAENLHHAGLEVSIVEMGVQVMAPIDFSMAQQVHRHMLDKGVKLYLEQGVQRFSKSGDSIELQLSSGTSLEADIVILSIGVRPETKLAREAGLKIGETGGIWVNEYLESSANDIYAVGDAIEYPHPITGRPWLNYLANPANRQGRIVADNMVLGNRQKYEGAIGTSIAKVFDLTVAATGMAAKRLKQFDIPYRSSFTYSSSHAGYYPGATSLTIKLIYSPDTARILGAQVIGYEGVDKRIDQIAMLIKRAGTVFDLIETEHAYAPPYSSAKDPIAIAAYVAANVISGQMPIVSWRDIDNKPAETVLLDVRMQMEHEMAALPGSLNIPLDELRDRLDELPKDKEIWIYCVSGLRGYLALKILKGNGFDRVKNLTGGYRHYASATDQLKAVSPTAMFDIDIDTQRVKASNPDPLQDAIRIDACGLQCPGPIMKLKKAIDEANEGEQIEILVTDPGFARDVESWCQSTGHKLLEMQSERGQFRALIEKSSPKPCHLVSSCESKGKTFILFSDDLDKALATFVLANGAAATGQPVTIFFTFWGLNVIKKEAKPSNVKKDLFAKMFSLVLPSSSKALKLSKINMFGLGPRMMHYIMKKKGIDSLETLRQEAIAQGVEMIACQMSMDVMGVDKSELIDEVQLAGVATYMQRAENANVNLFI